MWSGQTNSGLGFWPACISIRIMSQHCTIATWRDIYYTHCKGLTVLDYFYFPLSLHHYCCIIRVSLRQETGDAFRTFLLRAASFG